MGVLSNLTGIFGNLFQIGGNAGPNLVNSSGIIQARNAANNAFAVVQVAAAVNDNDAVNLLTLATYSAKPIPVTLQISGASSVPTNSTTQQYYLVTTTGVNASIGQIYYDDGSNAGNCTLFSASPYATIFSPSALTGGTITTAAASYYYWNTTTWVLQTISVAGAVSTTEVVIGFASATYSSTSTIPANAIIKQVYTKITTAFSGGTTLSVGITGTATLFLNALAQVTAIGEYENNERISIGGSAATALCTIAGSPGAGVGVVYIDWVVPLT